MKFPNQSPAARGPLSAVAVLALAAALVLTPDPGWASSTDVLFGSARSPILRLTDWLSSTVARAILLIAILFAIGAYAMNSDMSGLAKRLPIVVICGGVLGLAVPFVNNLFGSSPGASLSPAEYHATQFPGRCADAPPDIPDFALPSGALVAPETCGDLADEGS